MQHERSVISILSGFMRLPFAEGARLEKEITRR